MIATLRYDARIVRIVRRNPNSIRRQYSLYACSLRLLACFAGQFLRLRDLWFLGYALVMLWLWSGA